MGLARNRVFLRSPDQATPVNGDVAGIANLLPLVPPEGGLYKAWRATPDEAAQIMVQKLIGNLPAALPYIESAPTAAAVDERAGSESDLETRIDEQPLPQDAGVNGSLATLRAILEKHTLRAMLLVESTRVNSAAFVETPAVLALEADSDWDAAAFRTSLSAAAASVWTTSHIGAAWTTASAGTHTVERLDGLGQLFLFAQGRRMFLANDAALLAATLDRTSPTATSTMNTYAAGFRHTREAANFARLAGALDFNAPADSGNAPAFFSSNIASLSGVLAAVSEMSITQQDRDGVMLQTVRYQIDR